MPLVKVELTERVQLQESRKNDDKPMRLLYSLRDQMFTRVNYEIASFVVVTTIKDESDTPIWIGKVLSTTLDESGNVGDLQVYWFNTRSVKQRLPGRYLPSFHHDGDVKAHGAAWTDETSTDTVMVASFKLKVNSRTSISVLKLVCKEGRAGNGK